MPVHLSAVLFVGIVGVSMMAAGCGRSKASAMGGLPPIDVHSLRPYYARDVEQSYGILKSNPTDFAATETVAADFYYLKQSDQAEMWFERLSRIEPQSSRSWFELGLAQLQTQNREKAVTSFQQAVRLDANDNGAKLRLALGLLEMGRLEQSRTYFLDLIRRNPMDHYAYYGLGRIFSVQGDLAQAVKSYEAALKLFPDFKECRQALAHVLLRQSRRDEAQQQLAAMEKESSLTPALVDPIIKSVEGRLPTAAEWIRRGGERLAAGDVLGALEANLTALDIDPTRYQVQTNLIALYARAGEPDLAAAAFQTAVTASRESQRGAQTGATCATSAQPSKLATAYYNWGTVLAEMGKAHEAQRIYLEGLKMNPQDPDLNNAMGRVTETEGRRADAMGYYLKAVRAKSDFAEAHFNLGRLLALRHDYQAATEQFLSAVSIESPEQRSFFDRSVAIYFDAGEQLALLRFLKRAHACFTQTKQTEMEARIEHFSHILGISVSL